MEARTSVISCCFLLNFLPLFFYSGMNMKTVIILLCVSLFSWIGWWIGARFGLMAAYLLSFIGSLIGAYGGVRINREYMP